MSGGGERPWQSLASGSASRRKHSKGEAVLLASPLLGSREIRGDYPKTPLSKARLRGCRDGLRTGLGRGDTNLPLPGPRPNSPLSPGTATSGSPLGPASPRARTTPHGVLSLRSESLRCLLPAQNGGGGHRAARRLPQGYGSLRAQAPPLPAGSSFLPAGNTSATHLLRQEKMATLNHSNCNSESPAALEEAKTSAGLPSPQIAHEPRDFDGSLLLPSGKELHSEDEGFAPAGAGSGCNNRGSRTQSPRRCSVEAVLARKKHRRRPSKRKRHWRPYLELSWAEKQQRDERQSQRASRVREEMFAKGQPLAPYNTTQFLMNDRDLEEPNLDVLHGLSHPGSSSGENEAGDSDGQGRAHGEFQQRDFSEAYERYHTESLQRLSKQELVRDYLDLERRLSQAEQETRRLQQLQGRPSRQPCQQVEELAAEVERLRTENQRLRQENEMWSRDGSCCDQKPATEGTTGPQDEALFHTHVGQLGHKEAGDR